MKTKIKLDFKSLEKELNIISSEHLDKILGGWSSTEITSVISFYESLQTFHKEGLLFALSDYPGSIPSNLQTFEQKLSYLQIHTGALPQELQMALTHYEISSSLVDNAKDYKNYSEIYSQSQKDNIKLSMFEQANQLFNVVDNPSNPGDTTGSNTTSNNTTDHNGQLVNVSDGKYLLVKNLDELREYFKAAGLKIAVNVGYNGDVTLSLPTKDPNLTTDSSGNPIPDLEQYEGYGIRDVTTNTYLDKGKYEEYTGQLFQVDIVGINSYLTSIGYDKLQSNIDYGSGGEWTDGTTNDNMYDPNNPYSPYYDSNPNPYSN